MPTTKHQSPTEFAYPVARICGKVSKNSKVIHRCTPSGKAITYLQGERNLEAHPVSADELSRMSLFKRRSAIVSARRLKSSETYQADLAAYRAQYETGYKTFQAYLWSLAKAQIPE